MGLDMSALKITYVLIRAFIILASIFGNSLILSAVKYSKHFTRVTRHLIGHLAIADLLYGCVFLIHTGLQFGQQLTYPACIWITMGLVTSGSCSAYGISLVCLENYMSIRCLITGPESGSVTGSTMSLRCARILISAGWAVMFLSTIICLFNLQNFVKNDEMCGLRWTQFATSFLIFLWVLICTILISLLILMTLMLHRIHTALKTLFQAEDSLAKQMKQRSMQKKFNLARLFAIICLGFVISWGPFFVGLTIFIVCPGCGVDHSIHPN